MADAAARFRRIAADIERRIGDGEWTVGQALPSRSVMAAAYHVHPQTMRLAYVDLRRRGILEGEQRKAVYVAHPPAMRTLTDADAPWPYDAEKISLTRVVASDELAGRLDVPPGIGLQHEIVECLDPGGRSAMVICSWWRGPRRTHHSCVVEVGASQLNVDIAHALGLLADTVAYRLVRTRLDREGRPTETADLCLPMDRWLIRLAGSRH